MIQHWDALGPRDDARPEAGAAGAGRDACPLRRRAPVPSGARDRCVPIPVDRSRPEPLRASTGAALRATQCLPRAGGKS